MLLPDPVSFQRLEQRDGVVLDVDRATGVFRARLVDPRGHELDQEVDIELEQVSPAETHLVAPGALFYWAIGYVTKSTGRRNLVLTIEFRRLAPASARAREEATRDAKAYMEEMGWS